MSQRALVVEGGAMRGIFAAGVLDAFLEKKHQDFDFAVGASAGSTNLIGYLAGNHGRSRQVITDHACRPDFINWSRFMSGGHLCDVHWLWHQSRIDVPLNLERHWQGNTSLWVVTTSIEDGAPRYFQTQPSNLDEVITASCSIPFAYRGFPKVAGHPMTDGGLADSIPVRWAYEQGARDITVVLSRPQGFRKRPSALTPLLKPWARDIPAFYEAMAKRTDVYNRALDFIDSPPDDCCLNVIAPPMHFPVNRLTTNVEKLQQGYQQGHRAGLQSLGVEKAVEG
ncbi:patatin family protein [Alcanivorax sp.]|jgi:predicted patatin/cPLA2 family phospholipase|uniref:patatin-like phospholipase family protein n=1 Tax=Alcanivorax sp. TaxID=1872427 RepID=UPI00258E38DE|nr:patatin family protein [Alcanivorax sp.]